ncbi:hypothetical protein HAX54_027418 [Datura stramonium]|uniref:Uncharacterized protein n=1 Tax=Datura stramonium TaxID=4076 RepID=A0ABS8V399_DATST|nr:hypothetical protein [Datura stramonium]
MEFLWHTAKYLHAFQLLENLLHKDIRHIFCGENSAARWTWSENGVHSGIFDLQVRIEGKPMTSEEMTTQRRVLRYREYTMFMCKLRLTFAEPLDDDEPRVVIDAVDEEEKEDDDTEDANDQDFKHDDDFA